MRSEIGVTETDTPSQLRRPDRRQRAPGPRRMTATVHDDQVARTIDGIQALAAGARLEPQDAPVAAPAALLAEVFGAELASTRNVSGVTSLSKGACVVVEMMLAMQS